MSTEKLLIVVGPNRIDAGLADLIYSHDRTILFEPLPDACEAIEVQLNCRPGVEIVQAACGNVAGMAKMHRYNTNGVSSSLGTCTTEAIELYQRFDLSCTGTLEVPVINLADWLQERSITSMETLITDAQGMDLTILSTLADFLQRSAIKTVQCEADGDGKRMYDGLPSNAEEDFDRFFQYFQQYEKVRRPNCVPWNPDLIWQLSPQ